MSIVVWWSIWLSVLFRGCGSSRVSFWCDGYLRFYHSSISTIRNISSVNDRQQTQLRWLIIFSSQMEPVSAKSNRADKREWIHLEKRHKHTRTHTHTHTHTHDSGFNTEYFQSSCKSVMLVHNCFLMFGFLKANFKVPFKNKKTLGK